MSVNSSALVPLDDPAAALDALLQEVREEHGIELEKASDGEHFFQIDPFRLGFRATTEGLQVDLAGPSYESLAPIKEDVVSHIAEIDQNAAQEIRWSGQQPSIGELPPNFKILTIVRTGAISASMRRVTLSAPDVKQMASGGTHVRLMLPLVRGRQPVWPKMAANGAPDWPQGEDKLHARFVTLKNVRLDQGEVDIDIVRHAGGLISDWAASVAVDETVGIMGPLGVDRLPSKKGLFLAADETGLPFISRFLEIAGEDATGNVVVAASPDLDMDAYMPPTNLHIEVVEPKLFASTILDRAIELTAPGVTTYAHFAGEFENAQALRSMFKSRLGLDKNTQMSVAYWRRGVPGFGS